MQKLIIHNVRAAVASMRLRELLSGACRPSVFVSIYLAGLSLSLCLKSIVVTIAAAVAALTLVVLALLLGRSGSRQPNDSNHGRSRGCQPPEPGANLRSIAILVACLCLGLFMGGVRLEMLGSSRLAGHAGRWMTVDVTVTEPVKIKDKRLSFMGHVTRFSRIDQESAAEEDVMVQLECGGSCPSTVASGLEEGVRVRIAGIARQPASTPGADFDFAQYLNRRGVNMIVSGAYSRMEILPDRRGGPAGVVDAVRRHSRATLNIGQWGGASELLQGMVLGDDEQIPETVIADFRASGLLHLLAVSGQNVVLLGFIVMLICRALLVPRLAAAFIAILVICLYVPLTGAGPSIVRAGIVGVLGLMAFLLSRQTSPFHFMGMAAAIIMTLNPWSLLDPGFQLSFGAVLAIFLVAPLLSAPLAFLPAVLREGIAITTAASLVTAPIMMFHFKQISVVTVPANVAAEVVAGPVMLLGTLSILLAPVSHLAAWTINAVAALCTGYLISVAHFFASLPGAVYVGNPPGLMAIILFYGMLTGMVVLGKTTGLNGITALLRRRRRAALALVLAVLMLTGFACIGGGSAGIPPDSYTVSFLEVGQGDATLIQVPGGATVLIDGGPGTAVVDRLKESGVKRLDAVILTHPHADHLGGLDAVMGKYPVGAFYDSGFANASPAYRDLLKLVESEGIQYRSLRRGQTLSFGELTLTCLSPGDTEKPDDLNANSVVTVAAFRGLDILCPGDGEGEALASLDLPQVEVFKVGHHGSKDSSLKKILEKLKPDVTVISAGEGNSYGHPAEDTLAKLRAAGTEIYRTDRQGTVRVALTDRGVQIRTDR